MAASPNASASKRPAKAIEQTKNNSSMKKKKKQHILVAILAFVLLIVIVTSPKDESATGNADGSSVVTLVSLKTENQMTADGPNRMDPFVQTRNLPVLSDEEIHAVDLFQGPFVVEPILTNPQSTPTQPREEIKVGAIYGAFDGDRQAALINGKIVQSGEELESGAKVMAISPDAVHLTP